MATTTTDDSFVTGRLFGTSGIRGIVNKDLSIELCERVGKSLGSIFPLHAEICIATDTRQSRNMVKTAVCKGLLSTGGNVTDMGILPTPALALLTREMGFDTGIMITASHNPPEYNGIKLFNKDASGYSKAQEEMIERTYNSGTFRQGKGISKTASNMKQLYFSFISDKLSPRNNSSHTLKLLIDPGNGAASIFAGEIFRRLGYNVVTVNDEPDGLFPGRNPEPKGDTLKGTVAFLKEQNADVAICFDGDADRVVFCDREGFLGFDEMTTFISAAKVRDSGKKKVATTVETGCLLDVALKSIGGEVARGKVGDVNVAYLVKEIDAALGIEGVGVYIFPELGYYPDSIFAALYLLNNLESIEQIRDFIRALPKLSLKKGKVQCPNNIKQYVMDRLKNVTPAQIMFNGQQPNINTIDGLRVEFVDSWMLIRPSGTEPIVRIIAESFSPLQTDALITEGKNLVESIISCCNK